MVTNLDVNVMGPMGGLGVEYDEQNLAFLFVWSRSE